MNILPEISVISGDLEEIYKDGAFKDSPVFPIVEQYLIERESVIKGVQLGLQNPSREDALDVIIQNGI